MAVPWYRMPDAGMPARIVTPRISTPVFHKPRGIYTKGPITSQGVRLSTPKPRPKTSVSLASPKLRIPTRPASSSGVASGSIQLPGASSATAMAIQGLRSNAQMRSMARQAVMLEAQPQLNQLGSAYNQENKDYGYIINTLRKNLGLSTTDIKTLYDTLDANIAFNAKDQAKIGAQTKADMGKIYDQLSSQVGSNYQAANTTASNELNRLGIKDPNATSRLNADQALLQTQAQQSKANTTALQDAINTSTAGMMQGLRAGSASTGAMLQSGLRGQFDKESGDALQKHIATLSQIKMQKATLSASLPGKINQTYQALLDQQYQREMDAAQKLFDNQIKLGNFQLGQQNAQATQQFRQNELALSAARLAQSAAKKPAGPALKGMDKSLAYLQQVAKQSKVPYSTLENILVEAINGDPNRKDASGNNTLPAFNKNYLSEYSSDINNFLNQRGMHSLYTDMIRAMNYWFS